MKCAIRKRSKEINRAQAIKTTLYHDTRNTTSHIVGDHNQYNPDFCYASSKDSQIEQNDDDKSELEFYDILQQQSRVLGCRNIIASRRLFKKLLRPKPLRSPIGYEKEPFLL